MNVMGARGGASAGKHAEPARQYCHRKFKSAWQANHPARSARRPVRIARIAFKSPLLRDSQKRATNGAETAAAGKNRRGGVTKRSLRCH